MLELDKTVRRFLHTRAGVLAITFIVAACAIAVALGVAVQRARERAYASACQGKLSQLALAIRNYQEHHGHMPAAFIPDEVGRPSHSWRIVILPFMGEEDAYNGYAFSEPWNGPHNVQWARKHHSLAQIFKCPSDPGSDECTSYLAPTGDKSLWPGSKPHRLTDEDLTRVLLVEVRESTIHWMEPRDLPFHQIDVSGRKPEDPSAHDHASHMRVVAADGSVGSLSTPIQQ
jgi:hypothetical protein